MQPLRTATIPWLALALLVLAVGCATGEKPAPPSETKDKSGAVTGEKEKEKEGPPEGVMKIPRTKPPSTLCPPSMRGSC